MSSIPSVLLFALVICFSSAFAEHLHNNIIQFGSKQARESYVRLLKNQHPTAETINIDTVLPAALIVKHTSEQDFQIESQRLDRMSITGTMSILSHERDQIFTASDLSNQPSPPWHLDRIGQRKLPLDGKFQFDDSDAEVNVYVCDTGVRISHSEFEGRAAAGFSAVSGSPAGEDGHGHGSHVSGLVAGKTYGAAKKANIWDVRVLDSRGSGSTSGIIQGMDWIAKNHKKPAIVNMSLGGGYSQSINEAISSLFKSGVLPVVAAGNENTDACSKSPASAPDALTVGATEKSDARASFSNYGRCVDIYAPGKDITSVGYSSDTASATMSGTSMASPVTAGVAAYILSKNPAFTPAEVTEKILEIASTDVDSNIRPFVFYQPEDSGDQPSDPTDPTDPGQPATGRKVVAFLEGEPLQVLSGANQTLVLDGSFSHPSLALQQELCQQENAAQNDMMFIWGCSAMINHSEKSSNATFCTEANFPMEPVLKLESDDVSSLRGSGPVIFTLTVAQGGYSSQAQSIVIVE